MRTALISVTAALVLAPAVAHADPRTICIESTISDHSTTLSAPSIIAVDGEKASFKSSGDTMELSLALTPRISGGNVALDIDYQDKTRSGTGRSWTTRSVATHVVVKDREAVTLALPDRRIVITPTTQTTAGPCRFSSSR